MRLVKIPGMFGTWNEHKQEKKRKGIMGDSFYLNRETVLKAVFKGVTFALSYHNKVVV